MIYKQIENLKRSRSFLLEALKDLSLEQLNQVPLGFNNNIAWNLGHMVAAQQGVCYVRGGAAMVVDVNFFSSYKPGTKPASFVDEAELETMKQLMITTLDRLLEDHGKNIFDNYKPWTTRYGVELSSIDDAIDFLPYHDGLHAGIIMSLKKLVL